MGPGRNTGPLLYMKIEFKISQPDFLSEYQEKKPLLIKSAFSPGKFTWRDANEIFERSAVDSKDFKIAFNGIRPKHEYVESYLDIGTERHRLIKPVVYDYLKQGATLITNKVVREPMVDILARQIACFTGRKTISSLYAAFGELDSFRAHWDTRDVFAIQLIGRKRWIVYEPSFDSPLHMHQSKDIEHECPCPEDPYMDFILEAGDIFYLPRGWWHNPLPLGEETLHLAVGTFPAYTINYVKWTLEKLPSLIESRSSLSEWSKDQSSIYSLARKISEILTDEENYHQFMDQISGDSRVDTPLAIEKFGNPKADFLPENTMIRLGSNGLHGRAGKYIIANGVKVKVDSTSAALIRLISTHAPISLSNIKKLIDGVDSEKIQILVQQLCHQDVLELVLQHE